jgi:hypothetical protein
VSADTCRDAVHKLLGAIDEFEHQNTSLFQLLDHGEQLWEMYEQSMPGSAPRRTAEDNMYTTHRETDVALGNQKVALQMLEKRLGRVVKAVGPLQDAVSNLADAQVNVRRDLKAYNKAMQRIACEHREDASFEGDAQGTAKKTRRDETMPKGSKSSTRAPAQSSSSATTAGSPQGHDENYRSETGATSDVQEDSDPHQLQSGKREMSAEDKAQKKSRHEGSRRARSPRRS